MKNKTIFFCLLLFGFSTLLSANSYFLNSIRNQEFIGARPMALGETFVAIADDINAIYWNPAGLPAQQQLGLNSMHANLFNSAIGTNYLAVFLPAFPKTSLGVDWLNIDCSDDGLDFSKNKFNFSGGYQFFDKLALGFNIKYLRMSAAQHQMSEGTFQGWGTDWGLLFLPTSKLRLGMVLLDATNTQLKGIDGPVYRRGLRVGAAYRLFNNLLLASDWDDRLHLGAEWSLFNQLLDLRAGLQNDLYTDEALTFSYGLGLDIPVWGQRIRFDYAFTDTPTLPNTHRTSLSFLIDLFPQLLRVKEIEIKPTYASLYKYYAEKPIGEIYLDHKGKEPLNCTFSVNVNKYSRELSRTIIIPPQSIEKVDIQTVFNDSILLEADNIPLSADIKIAYTSGNRPKELKESKIFYLFKRNAIDWSQGVAQAAAFVTHQDPLIDDFSRTATNDQVEEKELPLANATLLRCMQLFHAVTEAGVQYREDPYSPYSKRQQAFDNIFYPAQTLTQKQGDCDDLSVLFAALFENQNIPTAFVSVPNHIFILANSGVHQRRAFQFCCAENRYVIDDQQIWIPLETTWLNHSFCEAWEKGAEVFNDFPANEREIIKIRDAWETYTPIASTEPILKTTAQYAQSNPSTELSQLQHENQDYLAEMEQKVAQFPDSLHLRNKLGILYAFHNQPEAAKKHFQIILARDSTHVSAHNNLGNLYFQLGNLDSAQFYYQAALRQATGEQNDGVQLNLGLMYAAADIESLAVEQFANVLSDSTDYQRLGDLLGIVFENDDLIKHAELKPKKKVCVTRVKKITGKAVQQKKKKAPAKTRVKKHVNLGSKGRQPTAEIENVFYWAE